MIPLKDKQKSRKDDPYPKKMKIGQEQKFKTDAVTIRLQQRLTGNTKTVFLEICS